MYIVILSISNILVILATSLVEIDVRSFGSSPNFFIKISFTLYPTHSRVGRGNLVLSHSVPHFPSNSAGFLDKNKNFEAGRGAEAQSVTVNRPTGCGFDPHSRR